MHFEKSPRPKKETLTRTKKTSSFLMFMMIFLSVICCPSCSTKKTGNTTVSVAKRQVMASFYPLYIMLLNITEGVEDLEVTMLAPADTGCLHDYQLTTRDMKNLEKCQLLVMNGAGMEDFVDKALELKSEDQIIVASDGFELIEENPHIWVSPWGAVHQVRKITEGLISWDEKNADLYERNAENYIQKIQSINLEMHRELEGLAGTKIISFHEAFPYFADEFQLVTVATIERDAGEDPSPRQLSQLLKFIKEEQDANGKIVLLAEPQYSSSAAQIIANETGLAVLEIDPAVTAEKMIPNKDAYLDAMRKNLEVLKGSLNVM